MTRYHTKVPYTNFWNIGYQVKQLHNFCDVFYMIGYIYIAMYIIHIICYIFDIIKAIVAVGVYEVMIIWVIGTYIPAGICLLKVGGGRTGADCVVRFGIVVYIP